MRRFLVIGIALIFQAGCAETTYWIRDQNRTVRMTDFPISAGYRLARRFEFKRTNVYLLWGLVPVRVSSLDDIFSKELSKEELYIGNLSIEEKYDTVDGLVDTVIYGLVRPYSLVVRGDVFEKTQGDKK